MSSKQTTASTPVARLRRNLPRHRGRDRTMHILHGYREAYSVARALKTISQVPRGETSMLANDAFHIAVLPGDGIGPEVMAPALEMLRKVAATTPGLNFRFSEAPAGAGYYREHGKSMPESTVKLCEEADAILLGACGLPYGALSRQHRDHAAGRAALHLRPLCRRAAVPAHSRRALPDRRRGRARHRPRA